MIRVLVVDDSAFMRRVISDMIMTDKQIQVINTARNGVEAVDMVKRLKPDVITLDVDMPRLDGLEVLRRIMKTNPVPIIMVSALTQAGADVTIQALELGAVDFVPKTSGVISLNITEARDTLIEKIKLAASVDLRKMRRRFMMQGIKRSSGSRQSSGIKSARNIVAIGTSTGGPRALSVLLPRLSADLSCGILVVQHMPSGFTASLAARLNRLCGLSVREASDGDPIEEGTVLIAPGNFHMVVEKGRGFDPLNQFVTLNQKPARWGVRPSADTLMESVAATFGKRSIGVLLTGMGSDGAKGLLAMRKAGAETLAENEKTCVVFGMPKAAVECGAVCESLPLHRIATRISDLAAKVAKT